MNDDATNAMMITRRSLLVLAASIPLGLAASDVENSRSVSRIDLGKFYRLRSALSSKASPLCVDIDNAIFTNGRNARIYDGKPYNGCNCAQCFHFKEMGDGSYVIRSIAATYETNKDIRREFMSLDVAGGVFLSGTNVDLYTYNGTASQRWYPSHNGDGTWTFYSAGNRQLCLDVANGSAISGTNLQLYSSNGTPSQRFYLEEMPVQPEPFDEDTDSTRFSALLTDIDMEDGNPSIDFNGSVIDLHKRSVGRTDMGTQYTGDAWGKYYSRWYQIKDSSAKVVAMYRTVGKYYGRDIGVRSEFSDFVPGPWGSSASLGRTMYLLVPEYFSQGDPGAMWILNVKSVVQTVEFFYSDDPTMTAIDIDQCYWSVDSLTNEIGLDMEYALPLETSGFDGKSYVLPDYLEKIGQPSVVELEFGNGGGAGLGYVATSSTRTDKEYLWANSYCGVTFSYSGRRLSLELGSHRRRGVDTYRDEHLIFGGCMSAAFRSLYKDERTPVHFVVYDPTAAKEDPGYSPKEVYQEGVQKGTVVDLTSDIVKAATTALMKAYPGAVAEDDYWWETNDFKDRFSSVTVKSEAIFIWAKLSLGKVEYYADGTDADHLAFTDANARAGAYEIPDKATSAALSDNCNLNDHFGDNPSTGFSGWFLDPGLTKKASDLKVSVGRTLKLYGRNRLTLRCAFTDDSVDISSLTLRTSPSSTAPMAEAWGLPDFGLSDEAHALDGLSLPAIGDDGPAHKALYLGESVALSRPSDKVFAHMDDGTWAGFRAVAWLASQDSEDGRGTVRPSRDTTVYMRVERADYDGVASNKR